MYKKRISIFAIIFFIFSIILYLATRFYRIQDYPIYFFTDEANIALLGESIFNRNWRSVTLFNNEIFPIYFEASGNRWTPVLPIYWQAIALYLFGKSVSIVRTVSVINSIWGFIAISLALKWIYKVRHWWVGVLFATITPTIFLHTRTAFETVTATSYFGCFIFFYLLYRKRSPFFLIPSILFAAATFYSYSNAQLVLSVSVLLLLLSDFSYHLKQWKIILLCAPLMLFTLSPFIKYETSHQNNSYTHLCAIGSYICTDQSFIQKGALFAKNYISGFDPTYWFFPNTKDIERHRMLNTGHLPLFLAPFFLLGLILTIKQASRSEYRLLLIVSLVAPLSAALANIEITRVFFFVLPFLIFSSLGWEFVEKRVLRKKVTYFLSSTGFFIICACVGVYMTYDAVTNGPLWFRNYGLYGMQYGARQLFEKEIPTLLGSDKTLTVLLSPDWANSPEKFISFFLTKDQQTRTRIQGISNYFSDIVPTENSISVLTPSEYERVSGSNLFNRVVVEKIISYPDGTPGFYFTHLIYLPDAQDIIKEEIEERRKPMEVNLKTNEGSTHLTYSRVQAGRIEHVFDGNPQTFIRGLEANPYVFDFTFSKPVTLKGIYLMVGTIDFELTMELFDKNDTLLTTYQKSYTDIHQEPRITYLFDKGKENVGRLRLQIKNLLTHGPAQIHIRELKLL